MTANKISAQATAAREAARDNGRFGEQTHTAPETALDIHQTQMAEGATRVMPLSRTTHTMWFPEDELAVAAEIAERHDVRGMVSRNHLPEGTESPAASYGVSLRAAHQEQGRSFLYETSDMAFDEPTPTVAEVLLETASRANVEHGAVTEDGHETALDNLIAVIGEQDARDLLARSYLRSGQLTSIG